MSAEPLPTPSGARGVSGAGGSAARTRRAEGLARSAFARPVLALVPNPVRARRAPFVALILGVLLVGLLSLLLLNTTTAQDAFKLHRLQASAANAADERQALSEQVNQLTGPGGLAAQAIGMGMVPVGPPTFWKPGDPLPPGARVLDGMIVVPAGAVAPAPSVGPKPAASAPANGEVAVTAVPRPGQSSKPSTSASGKASPKPSTSASARPSTAAPTKPSVKPSAKATTKPSAKATTKPTTAAKPSAGTTR